MATDFNPYHVWLGIPPEDQPANHYRLLSLRLFENDGDVIDSAADRQTAHLRTFQSGKHGNLTQRLLNEVAAARVCLLDPKKRAAYDQQLRAMLAASNPPTATAQPAPGGSAIQRQPPRRPANAGEAPIAAQAPAQAAAQPADPWSDLLGDPTAKPTRAAGVKSPTSAKAGAAKQDAKNRIISIGIAAGVVLIAGVAFGIYSLSGSGAGSEGTLVFDWPDRADVAVKVDGAAIEVPAAGAWEHNFAAGQHHVTAQRPVFKFAADVNLDAGQRLSVPADWKPKAMLVLSWPAGLRSGAVLKIDGRVQSVSQHDPLEVPVEPGRHAIQITRPNFDPINTSAVVAADARELVAIAAPPAEAKLVFDWPAGDRKDAELIVDGSSRTIADGPDNEPFALTLEPGRHVVQITRRGFEPFNQAVDLSAGTDSQIKPTWTLEKKLVAAPPVAETTAPVEVAPAQPAKKLPVPTAAEQEKIAKQLNDLYKTSQPGPKDPAKAQELYDVAAKDGSSPNERYLLLMKGAEIAAMAGDLNLSLSGIDAIDADYDIDALEAKQKLLEKFIAAGKADQVAIAIPTAEQLVDQAVAADRFDIAVVLATSASKAVAKSKIATHKEDEDRLSRRRHDIHLLEPIYASAKKAQETLGKTPADPEANLTVGRWLCFYKGDWTTGLPMLARGSDEKLKALAEQEIKSPTDADQQVQLADAWWDLAQKEAGIARDSLHLHAGNIYQAAMPNLASALKKAAIEKRLAEIADLKPSVAVVATNSSAGVGQPTGVVKFPLGQWVDVLRLVDTARDRLNGNWTRSGTELAVSATGDARICLPVIVEGGYDLGVDFTRTAGSSDIVTMLPVGSHSCAATLSAWQGEVSSLVNVDGHEAKDSENPTSTRPGTLENGHRYRLLISVRVLADNRGSIEVSLDGKRYLPSWMGNLDALSALRVWSLPTTKRLGLGAQKSDVTFHSVRLRIVSGRASMDPAVAVSLQPESTPEKAAPGKLSGGTAIPLGRWADILKLVDTTQDAVKGKWSRDGMEISCEHAWQARIEVPVVIDGAYDLEVEFTRTDGMDDVDTIIPVGSQRCNVVMSGWNGKASGLALIDGRQPEHDDNPTSTHPGTLENGHRYKVLISVRFPQPDRASIDVALDGKRYLPHWEGNPSSLSLNGDWALPHANRPGLATFEANVTYHAMRLKMISGHASIETADVEPTANSELATIVKARWGRRKTWVDVTAVVKEAVAKGEVVYANSGFLKVDPTEGRKKQLQITYKIGETEQATNINEGGKWSKDDYAKPTAE